MPNPFNFHGWQHSITERVTKIEGFLHAQHQHAQQRKAQGLADADDRSFSVLKRGLETIERDLLGVKARNAEVVAEHRDIRSIVSRINDNEITAAIRGLESRMKQLAYHVGIYDEVVQGIAIRPERAVPAIRINQTTGAPEINPIKVHTKTFWLATTPRTITVPANGQEQVSFVIPPEQNLEGDMEIYFLELASATSTSLRVRLNHTGLGGKYLSNQPHHILSAFGNMNAGPQPFGLYETIFLEPGMELIVELTDFSGAPNTVELVAHGRKFMGYAVSGMDRRGLIDVFARNTWPFWLTQDQPVLLTPSTTVVTPFSLTLERQIHAELAKVMRFGTVAGVQAPVDYHLNMTEGQSGNLLIDNVPINSVAGNGNFPFPLPEPYLALRGTMLAANARNDSGLAGRTIDLVFHGRALPISFAGQRSLEPLLDGRSIQLPPASNKDLAIPRMISM